MAELGLNFTFSSATGEGLGKGNLSSSALLVAAVTFLKKIWCCAGQAGWFPEGWDDVGSRALPRVSFFDFSRLLFPLSPTVWVLNGSEI